MVVICKTLQPFDKFVEKWELALFVFVSGGFLVSFSILLNSLTFFSFWIFYIIFTIIFGLVLSVVSVIKNSRKSQDEENWTLIKLKYGKKFKAIISKTNLLFITLKKGINKPIVEILPDGKVKYLSWKTIQFNLSEVSGIYAI